MPTKSSERVYMKKSMFVSRPNPHCPFFKSRFEKFDLQKRGIHVYFENLCMPRATKYLHAYAFVEQPWAICKHQIQNTLNKSITCSVRTLIVLPLQPCKLTFECSVTNGRDP